MAKYSKKINLLFVVGAYPPADKEGGPGIMIKALIEHLVDKCKIRVATTNKNGNEKLSFVNETVKTINSEVFYGDYNKSLFPYHSFAMLKYIVKVIDKTDFLFISSSWNLYGVIAGIIARIKQKPYAVYSHGSYHPVRIKKNRLVKSLWWFLFDKRLFNKANFVIAMSENEKSQVKSYGIKSNILVLPIGIDKKLVEPSTNMPLDSNLKFEKNYMLFLSRISEIKNLEYTFDYYADFLIKNDMLLIVAGGGDTNYVNKIIKYLDNHAARKYIKIIGVVSDSEKKYLLENAKFFTLLSKAEGLPQSVLEAMHFGLPVIASAECNLSDAINGKVVLCDNDNHTLQILGELVKDEMKYEIFSKNAKHFARQNFDWEAISKKYIANIDEHI